MASNTKLILRAIRESIEKNIEGRTELETRQIYKSLIKKGVFGEDFAQIAIEHTAMSLVRQVLQKKDSNGFHLFPNIPVFDPETGKRKNRYMREKYMKPPQYRQHADFWIGYSQHGGMMANETIRRCNKRYHTQWELPFPDEEEKGDRLESEERPPRFEQQ